MPKFKLQKNDDFRPFDFLCFTNKEIDLFLKQFKQCETTPTNSIRRWNYMDIMSLMSNFSHTLSILWVLLSNEYIVTTTIISIHAINLRPQKCINAEYLTSDIFVFIVYSRNKMQGKTTE